MKKKNKRGREIFNKIKPILNLLIKIIKLLPLSVRKWLLQFFRNFKGLSGIGIRYILISSIAKKCGENVSIHPNVIVVNPENLTLGNNISIHPFSYLDCQGNIIIGNDVSLAHGTSIMSTSHEFTDIDIPIKDQGLNHATTVINDNVWIGAKSTILYGITIHSGAIVGANSVVTKNVLSNHIVVGSPAKLIKVRSNYNKDV